MPIRPLTPALQEKARLELNENPDRVKNDLQHIKEWLAKQPHLRARTDDQWLLSFLRGCKFSLERTKNKLDLYYTLHNNSPELYGIKHTDKIFEELYSLGPFILLPKTAGPDAPRVTLIRPGRYSANKYNVLQMLAASNVIQKIALMEDDHAIVAGTVIVLDLQGVTLGHFLQMTPMNIKKMVMSAQDAAPIRMKGIHFINTPMGFETVYNAMKSLLNEKNSNRLFVHNTNYDELYKYVPQEILPLEYGGTAGTTAEIIAYWKKKVNDYDTFFQEEVKYGCDEALRPANSNTVDSFGTEGSFRKLEVD